MLYDRAPPLFGSGRIEDVPRDPLRPLGAFSDFVVEVLPLRIDELLAAGAGTVMARLRELAADVDAALAAVAAIEPSALAGEARAAARADAVYADNAFVRIAEMRGLDGREVHAAVVPPRLHRLVEETARLASAPPFLTYEDMILSNPLSSDPRIYTRGETGFTERDFCNGHRYVEFLLGQAIDGLESVVDGPAEALEHGLRSAARPLDEACGVMRLFRDRMRRTHFDQFRELFGKNPVHGALGPSGRFSARVAHLTILLVGDMVHREQPQFYRSLFELRALFPASGFARLLARIDPSFCPDVAFPDLHDGERPPEDAIRTVRQAVRSHRPRKALRDAYDRCKRLMDSFTRIHIAAARKYTIDPHLAAGGLRDGESVESVLGQRYRIGGDGPDE